eukprot:GEMP01007336.1.p1 GENE.GEMP01007336.1~~GEMP01007336.1.p1  ORF type:complete len:403 (+),score=60.58 GEMP01007336.1:157-1365(+)
MALLFDMLDERRVMGPNHRWKIYTTQRIMPPLLTMTSRYDLADTISYSLAHIGNRLIVADELGFIHVLSEPKVSVREAAPQRTKRISSFPCALTSIFDVEVSDKWNSTAFVASSDGTLFHADVNAETVLRSFKLHNLGIKCVREKPQCPGQLITASRDGSVAFVDVREDGLRPQWTMPNVHLLPKPEPAKKRRRRGFIYSGAQPGQTVTACAWLSDTVMATSGVADGKLKLWDLRKWPYSASEPMLEMNVYPRHGTRDVGVGISWLDCKAGYLLASCPRAGAIKVYRVNDFLSGEQRQPVATNVYRSLVHDSYYFRPKFSPNAELVAVGNSEQHVTMWKVREPLHRHADADSCAPVEEALTHFPDYTYAGHEGEVTMVSWDNCCGLASTGDDGMIFSWSVLR